MTQNIAWLGKRRKRNPPGGKGGKYGEDALEGEKVYRGEGAVDRERRLRQQRADGLEEIRALDSAVQVQVNLRHESRLVAEVQNGLRRGICKDRVMSSVNQGTISNVQCPKLAPPHCARHTQQYVDRGAPSSARLTDD